MQILEIDKQFNKYPVVKPKGLPMNIFAYYSDLISFRTPNLDSNHTLAGTPNVTEMLARINCTTILGDRVARSVVINSYRINSTNRAHSYVVNI